MSTPADSQLGHAARRLLALASTMTDRAVQHCEAGHPERINRCAGGAQSLAQALHGQHGIVTSENTIRADLASARVGQLPSRRDLATVDRYIADKHNPEHDLARVAGAFLYDVVALCRSIGGYWGRRFEERLIAAQRRAYKAMNRARGLELPRRLETPTSNNSITSIVPGRRTYRALRYGRAVQITVLQE